MQFIESIGKTALNIIRAIGKLVLFIYLFFQFIFKPKFYLKHNSKYFIEIFISSIPIIALTGIFLEWC